MADNVPITAGAGTDIATDDIAGIHYQRVKLADGTADSATPVNAGGGVEANALRVTMANDSTGVLSVDDNGAALTVDGTVTAELSATDNAVLDTIDTAIDAINAKLVTGTVIGDVNLGATDNAVLDAAVTALQVIDNMISGSEAQVDVITMPTVTVNAHAVTVASAGIASGALAAGSVASGAMVDLGLIADAAVDGDASGTVNAHLRGISKKIAAGVGVTGTFYQATQPTSDAGSAWTAIRGVSGAAVLSADMTTAAHVTDAPTAGQKIVVTDIIVSVDTAMSVLFEDHTGTDQIKVYMSANSTLQITPRTKMKLAVADDVLTAKASVAGNIAVTVYYYSEA